LLACFFFFSSRRRHTRSYGDWSSDVCSSDLQAETIAVVPSTLWSLTVDPNRPGSLVQSVDGLALAARAVRDQLSNDTWMVLAGEIGRASCRERVEVSVGGG